jgi:hypothetical protein
MLQSPHAAYCLCCCCILCSNSVYYKLLCRRLQSCNDAHAAVWQMPQPATVLPRDAQLTNQAPAAAQTTIGGGRVMRHQAVAEGPSVFKVRPWLRTHVEPRGKPDDYSVLGKVGQRVECALCFHRTCSCITGLGLRTVVGSAAHRRMRVHVRAPRAVPTAQPRAHLTAALARMNTIAPAARASARGGGAVCVASSQVMQ